MLRSVQLWLLTATLAVPGSCLAAQIQPVGYACTPEGCSTCSEGCQNACNDGCNGYGDCYGNCYGNCNGRCTPRQTWRDNCMNWTGHCGPIGRAARWGVPGARCLKHCCDTKAAPDSGWAPPARYPVNRTNTGFAAYSSYGGSYAAAPMVYQPTDTTQLGYSYAHVPTWRRNPAMIPPTPEPSAFHARACPGNGYCGSCMGGCMMNGYGNCYGNVMQGQIINQPVSGGYCPACTSQTTPAPAPASSTEGVVRMSRPTQPVQPAVEMQAVPVTSTVRPNPVIRQTSQAVKQPVRQQRQMTQRQTTQRPTRKAAPQKKGGWFGLPSLSEVQF